MHHLLCIALLVASIIFTDLCTPLAAAQSNSVVVITKTSSSCTRPLHTVFVYTSGSSTYIVQDLGSASLCSPTLSPSALGSAGSSSSSPPSPRTSSPFLSHENSSSGLDTLWCAPTTVTAPGACQDIAPASAGSVLERTITSYIYGSNSAALRTITSQIPAITSYVYRSGSQECAPNGYERTVTSRAGSAFDISASCPTIATAASCPTPDGNNTLVSVRTITSQLPAMTSYVYRSAPGLTMTVTDKHAAVVERSSSLLSPRDVSFSSSLMDAPTARTITSFVYANTSSSCSPNSVIREQTFTSYIYGSNTTVTIHAQGSACEPSFDSSDAPSSNALPNESSSSQQSTAGPLPNGVTLTTAAPGQTETISVGSIYITTTVGRSPTSLSNASADSDVSSITAASSTLGTTTEDVLQLTTTAAGGAAPSSDDSLVLTTTAAGVTETITAGSFYLATTASVVTLTLSEGSVVVTTTARMTVTTSGRGSEPSDLSTFSDADSTSADPSDTSLVLQPTPSPVTANASSLQQQGVASDPYVMAQVVNPQDNPPVVTNGDNDFLLVTFGTTSEASSAAAGAKRGLEKRQSAQALSYNTTQYFSSVAGGIYNLSASAANAQNGNTPPNCALRICASGQCGAPQTLDTSFRPYYFVYNAQSTASSDIATFSIQCVGPAYVGLDNVGVTPIYLPPVASSSGSQRYVAKNTS